MENNLGSIHALNQLLQGEYMAVDTFNIFISELKNELNRETFQDVQSHHRKNISNLAEYIQNIGGKPHENLGLKGTMADFKIKNELSHREGDSDVIKKAVEGEIKGINMAEKVLRGNLDSKSRDIAGEILHQDRKSLQQLQSLM